MSNCLVSSFIKEQFFFRKTCYGEDSEQVIKKRLNNSRKKNRKGYIETMSNLHELIRTT